jgi:hypothetical protein
MEYKLTTYTFKEKTYADGSSKRKFKKKVHNISGGEEDSDSDNKTPAIQEDCSPKDPKALIINFGTVMLHK